MKYVWIILLLSSCTSLSDPPRGFVDYCKRNPTTPECGGVK